MRAGGDRSSELMLSIGGVVGHIELLGAPPLFIAQMRARYRAFEMPVAPGVARDVSLRLEFVSAASASKGRGERPVWEEAPLVVSAAPARHAFYERSKP